MPNQLFLYDELKGLSYSKVGELMLRNGFDVWESLDAAFWKSEYGAGGNTWVRGVDPSFTRGRDPQPIDVANPCHDPMNAFLREGIACPNLTFGSDWVPFETHNETLIHDLPVGMTGVQFTDGSNMLMIGRFPGSDRIEFSKSWYHTVDNGLGQKLGEYIVKAILGAVTGGWSQLGLMLVDNTIMKPEAPTRPVAIDVPESQEQHFQPIDEVMTPVDPSGGMPPQNPADDPNLPAPTEPGTLKSFPWLGVGAVTALFLM